MKSNVFLAGSPDFPLGFFISKIITQLHRLQAKKGSFRHFWQLGPQKTENSTFSRKLIKNHKFHVHKVTNEKIIESVVI